MPPGQSPTPAEPEPTPSLQTEKSVPGSPRRGSSAPPGQSPFAVSSAVRSSSIGPALRQERSVPLTPSCTPGDSLCSPTMETPNGTSTRLSRSKLRPMHERARTSSSHAMKLRSNEKLLEVEEDPCIPSAMSKGQSPAAIRTPKVPSSVAISETPKRPVSRGRRRLVFTENEIANDDVGLHDDPILTSSIGTAMNGKSPFDETSDGVQPPFSSSQINGLAQLVPSTASDSQHDSGTKKTVDDFTHAPDDSTSHETVETEVLQKRQSLKNSPPSTVANAIRFFQQIQDKQESKRLTSLAAQENIGTRKTYMERCGGNKNSLKALFPSAQNTQEPEPMEIPKDEKKDKSNVGVLFGQPTVVAYRRGAATVYNPDSAPKFKMYPSAQKFPPSLTENTSSSVPEITGEAAVDKGNLKTIRAGAEEVEEKVQEIDKGETTKEPVENVSIIDLKEKNPFDDIIPEARKTISPVAKTEYSPVKDCSTESVGPRVAALMARLQQEARQSYVSKGSPKPISQSRISAIKKQLNLNTLHTGALPEVDADEEDGEEKNVSPQAGRTLPPLVAVAVDDEESEEEEEPVRPDPNIHRRSLAQERMLEGFEELEQIRSKNRVMMKLTSETISELSTRTTSSPGTTLLNSSLSLLESPNIRLPSPGESPESPLDMSRLLARNMQPSMSEEERLQVYDRFLAALQQEGLSGEEHLSLCRQLNQFMSEDFERELLIMRSAGIRTMELVNRELMRNGIHDPDFDAIETRILTALSDLEQVLLRRVQNNDGLRFDLPNSVQNVEAELDESMGAVLDVYRPLLEDYERNMNGALVHIRERLIREFGVFSPGNEPGDGPGEHEVHDSTSPPVQSGSTSFDITSKTGSFYSSGSTTDLQSRTGSLTCSEDSLTVNSSESLTGSSTSFVVSPEISPPQSSESVNDLAAALAGFHVTSPHSEASIQSDAVNNLADSLAAFHLATPPNSTESVTGTSPVSPQERGMEMDSQSGAEEIEKQERSDDHQSQSSSQDETLVKE